MVAESNPARRRADSSPRRPTRRTRLALAGLAVAALAGVAAAPLAANAGVDPSAGLQAVLAFAGGAGSLEGTGLAKSGPPQVVDETTGLRVRVAPTIATTLSFEAPVAISVEIENATGEAIAPGVVRLVRAGAAIDDDAELDDWLAADAEGSAGIGSSAVPLGEGDSRSLAAGGAAVVSFTVPGEAFADVDESAVIGLGAELMVGDTVVAAGTAAYANADVAAAGSVAVALAAPLTTPTTGGAVGLIDADRLTNWTGPTGLLTRQLDALSGRRVAIGIDPRIIASIRVLGSSAPASATAWLQRLANVPNEVFPLAYADADLAVQAQLALPSPLTPTSFSDVLDPANFAAQSDDAAGDDAAGGGASAPATDEPSEPEPTPGQLPTAQELLDWPYTRTDLAWPADDTVAAGDLAYFDAAGLTTALLAPGNVEPVDGPTSSSATIDGSTALVADAGLTEPLRAASDASTDTEWGEATGRLLAELALDAGTARTTVLATFDRGSASQSARVSALIDEIAGSGWSSLAGLADAIGAPPETRMLIDEPESDQRVATVARMVETEAQLTEFATVLDDEALLTGPTRRELLSLLDVAWLDDREAWDAAVADWLAAQRSVLGAVSVVPSSTINVVSTETGVPTTIENTLPYAVTVVVNVDPSNGRLIVEDRVEVTVEPQSRSTVRVPVAAGVGNGEVSLAVSLTSTTGVPIGSTVVIPANVQADWEGLGAAVIATIVVLVFGIGVWRNVRRRRRERAATAAAAAAAATAVGTSGAGAVATATTADADGNVTGPDGDAADTDEGGTAKETRAETETPSEATPDDNPAPRAGEPTDPARG
ncbi:DUF6049 family protein [Agromyces sp. Soil535]|uniref:DUF6049 family protein n=1 Tax=Agromyces sp. Soil535 TaxID=1736390 RepID=UPI000700AF8B|nr:DUF6049 family protein [Agromyces sp. Soil535]KRE31087.1 hypothetical protein ASG80_00945 [Agromyces sp. Soil535]